MTADPMLHALSQQSSALTTLIAHLTSSSDPLGDLSVTSSTGATSSLRGAQRRERLQSELSSGSSTFFHQMLQQMHRRMFPAREVPQTDLEFQGSQLSMLSYLERFGGYKHHRENGLETTYGPRTSCISDSCIGASHPRWGGLGHSIFDDVMRRPASADIPRQTFGGSRTNKAFRSSGSRPVVHGHFSLFEGTRGDEQSQAGVLQQSKVVHCQKRRFPVTKTETQISSEAKSFPREPSMSAESKGHDQGCHACFVP